MLIPAGNYYVGDVFGKQDYRGQANAVVSSYRIMKTEVTYALYRSVSDWCVQHGYRNSIRDARSVIREFPKIGKAHRRHNLARCRRLGERIE